MLRIIIFVHLIILTLSANSSYIKQLQNKALQLNLDSSRQWQLLVHYKKNMFFQTESLIDDDQFFIAPEGKKHPKAELLATIDSFFQTSYENNNSLRTKCIFVERYHWLKEQLSIDEDQIPKFECTDYKVWKKAVSGEEAVLITLHFI